MKLTKLFFVLFLLMISSVLVAQEYSKLNTIAVGIGGKNATFDESKFKDISFYYTPGLKSEAQLDETGKSALALFAGDETREVFEGEPKVLAEWWWETDLRNYAIVFDKNGVGSWQGKLNVEDEIIDSDGEGEEESFEDIIEFLIEDDEVMDYEEDKEFDMDDSDCLIERKMIDLTVSGIDGKEYKLTDLIENGKPTMVVFFQISKDVDLQAIKNVKEDDEPVSSFLGGMLQTGAGVSYQMVFKKIEQEIYGYEVPEDTY